MDANSGKKNLSNNFILFDGEIRVILGAHLGVMRVMRAREAVGERKGSGWERVCTMGRNSSGSFAFIKYRIVSKVPHQLKERI